MSDVLPAGLDIEAFSSTVRVQDDLYRHVNGPWLESTEIPEDKARWGAFHLLAEQAERDVRTIVEDGQNAEPHSDLRKVGDLYQSFMDTERIEELGTTVLDETLARVRAVDSIPAFLQLLGTLQREGVPGLFSVFVEPDPGNPERYVSFLYQGGISLPDESYYRQDGFAEVRERFRDYIRDILGLAGVTDADQAADRIVALEHDLAAGHWDNVRSRDAVKTYNLHGWADLQELAGTDLGPWRDSFAPDTADAFAEVVVYQPSFIEHLGAVLTEERLEDLKSWLGFQVIRSAAPYLNEALVDANFAFYGTVLTGVPVIRERWKRGVAAAEGALGEAIGKAYVERHFPPRAKAAMDELVANLIAAYRESIEALEWMGQDTRQRALEKLAAFTPKIGYPNTWRDYGALEIDATDLLGNVRRAHAFALDVDLAKVGGPIDRDEWHMTPQTVNAYYHPLMNEIVFPAAILQYPFFDPDRDAAANYGGIGSVIGHEIGHGFDDQGSRYDGTGKLNDWWTDADRAAFEERTGALIEQYNRLTPEGLGTEHTVNGALTIGENIGDLGGLGIALKAYELSLRDATGTQAQAPEIDGFSGLQRLFLSWAQVWQQKSREAETIRLLTIDPHSPPEFRCNQIARNLDEFYDAFGVDESDAMWLAPEERVTIW